MPGIEWNEDCQTDNDQGQHNMKCMKWNEDHEKVINVICIVECEAKKFSSSSSAYGKLDEIRVSEDLCLLLIAFSTWFNKHVIANQVSW